MSYSKVLISLFCLCLSSFSVQAENWVKINVPTHALDAGIGSDGSAWLVSADGTYRGLQILTEGPNLENQIDLGRYMNFTGFVKMSDVGGVAIDVDPQGNPWIVQAGGNILRWENGNFIPVPGQARDIGIGPGGNVWIVGTDRAGIGGQGGSSGYKLMSWDGSAWQPLGVDGRGRGAMRVTVGPSAVMSSDEQGKVSKYFFTYNITDTNKPVLDIAAGGHGFFPAPAPRQPGNFTLVWALGSQTDAGGNAPLYFHDPRNAQSSTQLAAMSAAGTRIASGPSGRPLLVNNQGEVWKEMSNMVQVADYISRPASDLDEIFSKSQGGGLTFRKEWVATGLFPAYETPGDVEPGDVTHTVPMSYAYPGQEIVVKVLMPKVPNVVGKSASEGVAELQAMGYQVTRADVWPTNDEKLKGTISQMQPAAGTPFAPGSQVWYVHYR